jgi:hypothetical protein
VDSADLADQECHLHLPVDSADLADQECHHLPVDSADQTTLAASAVPVDQWAQQLLEWFKPRVGHGLRHQKMEWETTFLKIKQIK